MRKLYQILRQKINHLVTNLLVDVDIATFADIARTFRAEFSRPHETGFLKNSSRSDIGNEGLHLPREAAYSLNRTVSIMFSHFLFGRRTLPPTAAEPRADRSTRDEREEAE